MSLDKRDVFHDGVWCIADMKTDTYKKMKMISQATVNYYDQKYYGYYMIYLCTVIIFLFTLKRFLFIKLDKLSYFQEKSTNWFVRFCYKVSAFNRFFSYRRLPFIVCELLGIPSSLGNLLVISSGLLYFLCYALIPHFWYRECRGFGSPPLSIRTGAQSTALVPILFILSGKSNLISGLTGISYEKLNVYHRWVSIISYIAAWIHTAPFYIQSSREGGLARLAYMQKTNILFRNGIPPLIFMTVLCILSHSYIRQAWYELFIHLHWICALGFYISLFYHIYPELNTQAYLYATVVFWMTQLFYRAAVKSFLKPNKGFLRSNPCQISRYKSTSGNECFQVVVENTNEFFWRPGQHVFLRFPGWRVLDNHPFSIVNTYDPAVEGKLKLIIKPMKGLTKMIYGKIPETGSMSSKVLLDGPYGGCERDYNSFNSMFLIASGTGISALVPFLIEGAQQISANKSMLKSIRLDWIIRNDESVEWIYPELNKLFNIAPKAFFENGTININIYSTNTDGTTTLHDKFDSVYKTLHEKMEFSSSDEEDKVTTADSAPLVELYNGKPIVGEIMSNIKDLLLRKNIFIVSGSESLKQKVGNSVAAFQRLAFSGDKIQEAYLHTESFGW